MAGATRPPEAQERRFFARFDHSLSGLPLLWGTWCGDRPLSVSVGIRWVAPVLASPPCSILVSAAVAPPNQPRLLVRAHGCWGDWLLGALGCECRSVRKVERPGHNPVRQICWGGSFLGCGRADRAGRAGAFNQPQAKRTPGVLALSGQNLEASTRRSEASACTRRRRIASVIME